ncbi:MAG: hypothetical protein L0387_27330 [Acidobacteria bacterium]|nr:hypothetical protein [Acidobacteriota bacterium]
MEFQIVIYSTEMERLERLRPYCNHLPYIRLVLGHGPDATEAAELDALWMTPMGANYVGLDEWVSDLQKHEAHVYAMPKNAVTKGLPRFAVVGVLLTGNDPRDPEFELGLIVSSMCRAIRNFNRSSEYKLRRIGMLPEDLWLQKLDPGVAFRIIEKTTSESYG